MRKKFGRALAVGMSLLMVTAGVALADNAVADGDGLTPVDSNSMSFGSVSCGVEAAKTALIAIKRTGSGTNVFADGEVVTVSVLSVSGSGLSASIPASASTITLPSNWAGLANNTMSSSVSATVRLTSATPGAGSGSVEFRATGRNSSGNTITRDDEMDVSWTTGTCTVADTTDPVVSISLSPASPDGSNSWYVSDVQVTISATDASGIASTEYSLNGGAYQAYSAPFTVSADGNHTVDARATDASSNANVGNATQVAFQIDQTDPLVSRVGGPADGATYVFGSAPAAPTCTASDATSGLSGSATPSPSGYSSAVGSHMVTCSASDLAGNSASDSASYTVLAWSTFGFHQPVGQANSVSGNGSTLPTPGSDTVWNTVKGGSTVPLKFNVFAGAIEKTSATADVIGFTAHKLPSCNGSGGADEDLDFVTSGKTELRYDSVGGQFVQNWATPKVTTESCYRVLVRLADNSYIAAFFKLRK